MGAQDKKMQWIYCKMDHLQSTLHIAYYFFFIVMIKVATCVYKKGS